MVPLFLKEIYIEETDFALVPPPKYKRLVEGGMIRLKGSYILKHVSTELDENGAPKLLHCEYIEDSAQGGVNAGIKVKGVVQWVSANKCVDCELYKYESLLVDATDEVTDFNDRLNPNSLEVVKGAKGELCLDEGEVGKSYQFMRAAYYKYAGKKDGVSRFYRIVSLKDTFNK